LFKTRITSIDLKQLKALHKLDLSHNSVKDFSSLVELRCLRDVDAGFNGIKSMSTFKSMNNLLWLSLKGNELEQIEFDKDNR
jgi:Leucine-rich repeat (LRR) protein